MAVTRDEVVRVAALARLRLEPDEVESLTRELNGILDHVDALAAADPADGGPGEDPEDHAGRESATDARRYAGDASDHARAAPLRADIPAADPLAFTPERLAPAWEAGHFTVPRLPALDEDVRRPDMGGEEAGAG